MFNAEDILGDSISLWGDKPVSIEESLRFGKLEISVSPKVGKANTLLADHLFSPALLLAERIERDLFPLHGGTWLELGAGCGLPSLVAASIKRPPKLIVVTDYPDEVILGNLGQNVNRNRHLFSNFCELRVQGYDWDSTSANVLLDIVADASSQHDFNTSGQGYDFLVMSDLLHFDSSHERLLHCISLFLKRSQRSRVYIAIANYTKETVWRSFLNLGRQRGLWWLQGEMDPCWRGTSNLSGLDNEQLGERKRICKWWEGGWTESQLSK